MTSATQPAEAHEAARTKLQAAIAYLHIMENTFESKGAADNLPPATIANALTGIRQNIEEADALFGQS